MARLLLAHRAFGPQLKLNTAVGLDQLSAWISMRSNLNKGQVMMTFQELCEAILYFNLQGTPVKVPGIGTFSPKIDRDGNINVFLRPDANLRHSVNVPRAYSGPILNKGNIGLSNEEYKLLWDQANPSDPLEI